MKLKQMKKLYKDAVELEVPFVSLPFQKPVRRKKTSKEYYSDDTIHLFQKFQKPPKLGIPKINLMNNGSYPNVQRGDYENSKGTMYFRSKWEANYALVLDFLVKQKLIKDWFYEIETFVFDKVEFGTRRYIPDFKVYNNDGSIEYHEIKGYMDGRSKTKLRRMKKYYPEVKLVLIEKDEYNTYKKQLGKALHFY